MYFEGTELEDAYPFTDLPDSKTPIFVEKENNPTEKNATFNPRPDIAIPTITPTDSKAKPIETNPTYDYKNIYQQQLQYQNQLSKALENQKFNEIVQEETQNKPTNISMHKKYKNRDKEYFTEMKNNLWFFQPFLFILLLLFTFSFNAFVLYVIERFVSGQLSIRQEITIRFAYPLCIIFAAWIFQLLN